jgi:macrolide transport system ATP-binding/permease protein
MSFIQDIRYGLRMIVKAPAFTTLAILALALGVCANTTIFSLINGLVLRPLTGVKDPSSLAAIYTSDYSSGLYGGSSYPDFLEFRAQADTLEGAAAYIQTFLTVTGATETERLSGLEATGNYFQVLGVNAQLGRTLTPEDEQAPNAQSVVISDGLWRRRFNADANVVGQTLNLNNTPYTIVGVVDPNFRGLRLGAPPDFYIPMSSSSSWVTNGRNSRGIAITSRLKPGVSMEQAQAQLTAISARLAQAYPESNLGTLERPNDPRPVTILRESRIGPEAGLRFVSTLLFIVVGLVLLIACANVANLLLARASVRRREIAVRLALGASRGRLVRQLLTESLLLALMGGAAGLLVTQWTAGLLPKFIPDNEAINLDLSIDWRVLAFTLGISVLTGMLFGLTPALQATRLNLLSSLKADSKIYGQKRRRIGLRDVLVISQLAMSMVLLICAALFVRSLQQAVSFDPGFAAQNILVASMETRGADLNKQKGHAFYDETLQRVGSLPGVEAVTLSTVVPISGGGQRRFITLEGYQPQPQEDTELNTNVIGPDFFKVMGIPFVTGRDFNARDTENGPRVVIVNEELARRYYAGNAIGKRLQFGSGEEIPYREIVGVVRTAKYRNLREEPLPFIYIPMGQEYQPGMALMLRTAGDPVSLAGPVRSEMQAINKDVAVFSVEAMSERLQSQIAADRMIAVLLSVFAVGALLLATIGIYGVVAFSVAQRTHEIGIRIALGAEQRDILKLIVGEGMFLVLIGAGIGVALALASTRVLKSLLFGISATDPLTFAVVGLVLVGVALLACYLPARRATKVDPLVALRYE